MEAMKLKNHLTRAGLEEKDIKNQMEAGNTGLLPSREMYAMKRMK
jgi:hypothetical protein